MRKITSFLFGLLSKDTVDFVSLKVDYLDVNFKPDEVNEGERERERENRERKKNSERGRET